MKGWGCDAWDVLVMFRGEQLMHQRESELIQVWGTKKREED